MPANNPTNYSNQAAITPPEGSFVITPSDSTDILYNSLPIVVRGLFLESAGSVKVTWANGMEDTLPLAAGGHNMRVRKIFDTGTDAITIHGLV